MQARVTMAAPFIAPVTAVQVVFILFYFLDFCVVEDGIFFGFVVELAGGFVAAGGILFH